MEKYLFIAEKPSLMRQVKAAYENHKQAVQHKVGIIDFIALSGHVCTNYEPNDYSEWKDKKWGECDYPIIPAVWKIKAINDKGKKSTIATIKKSAGEYDGFIVGTDSDVEGYGIYYLLEQYLHLNKKKALRFVERSLTDKEIFDSLMDMTDFHTDPRHIRITQSFLVRSRTDWLFGMNATRMLSLKQNQLMRVGRVKAPTIKLVYDNCKEIDDFVPKKYQVIVAQYDSFSAMLSDGDTPVKLGAGSPAPTLMYPLDGVVAKRESTKAVTRAPQLFDLPACQAEAGRVFKFTPAQTLEIVQSLYEKQIVSYPRTECRYVSSEKALEFSAMLQNANVFNRLAGINITADAINRVQKDKNVVNNAKREKGGHDALIPTLTRPNLSALSADEVKICEMIYTRFVAQFMNPLTEEKTKLVIRHGEGMFNANGKVVMDAGWSVLYKRNRDSILPDLKEGDAIKAESIAPVERVTKPPKRLTQSTLLNAMSRIASQVEDKALRKSLSDSQGIGTPATRAAIISEIIKSGYVADKKDGLYMTDLGTTYIDSVKGLDIAYPLFAAQIDAKIKEVQHGDSTFDEAMDYVTGAVHVMCQKIEKMPQSTHVWGGKEIKCSCPKCGKTVQQSKWYYTCDCGWKIRRYVCDQEITTTMLKKMISGITTDEKTFTKKNGDKFTARLKLNSSHEVEFAFGGGLER